MPFQIIRDDITQIHADAIVNTANPKPIIGSGVDMGIHAKAGPKLLAARKKIGDIRPGEARITPGFNLHAKYVIHTVGPVWIDGTHDEPAVLKSCYTSALSLAQQAGCNCVAFPLISTGNYGFPKPLALNLAIQAISAFLLEHELQVYLIVFNKEAFQLSEKLFDSIKSFIDDNYAEKKEIEEYRCFTQAFHPNTPFDRRPKPLRQKDDFALGRIPSPSRNVYDQPSASDTRSLTELLKNTDAGFSDTLLKLIDERGCKDSDVYKRANITKQHFYKIRKNPDYRPTKATAVALAIALKLDLAQTKDLIGRAGYALTSSSKFDVIIMYFIREKNYDLFEINAALFEFDQCLLGGAV